ncbi:hypothetical protein [Flavobacterium davisii]|uniref:hypothetical protein n=1 Tax=Flavobacterium davisii TaxID=2906077 RepID=UPI0035B049C2
MKKLALLSVTLMSINSGISQNIMTPDLLWKLGRVTPIGLSKDGKNIIYKVGTPSVEENKSTNKFYSIPVTGGSPIEIEEYKELIKNKNISPDGMYLLSDKEVKITPVLGKDIYPELSKSDAQVYDGLDYRHWDTWRDGTYNHVFFWWCASS